MEFVIVAILVVLAVVLLWWLLIETEGVYLGRRVVIWLYDVYASRYDNIKAYQPEYEQWLLVEPLLGFIEPLQSPIVLDVATGTGRLPLALLENSNFQGRVIGIDLSRKMLEKAAEKTHDYSHRIAFIWKPAEDLAFPDNKFDVVTCLESLEFFDDPEIVLREMTRVLRPGGLLLISNRMNARFMPGKIWSDDRLCDTLNQLGIENIQIEPWQLDYKKIWGFKQGESAPTGAIPVQEILQCPRCPDHLMIERDGEWFCTGCKAWTRTGDDGVIELFPLYTRQL